MQDAPVAGSRSPEGTWRRFRSLGLVLLLLVASRAPATAQSIAHMQRKASAARARRQAQLTKREEWEKLRKQAPRRETVETCVGRACSIRGLMASLSEGHGLVFCRDCPDPHVQGSWMDTWEAVVHPHAFQVSGEVVYAVPNDASKPLVNAVGGAIVLVDRGGVPILDKILRVQDAGASAVVIVDDGGCGDSFECGGWLGSRSQGLLGSRDSLEAWQDVFIPAVMVTRASGERLRALLDLMEVVLEDFGRQFYVVEGRVGL